MKICVCSDIHGNSIAWENMYRRERNNVDKFFFLGDVYGYFYDQAAIIRDFIEDERVLAIRGNHDEYYIKYFMDLTGAELKEVDEVVDYAEDIWSELVNKYGCSYRQKLDKQYKQYLKALPESATIEIDGKRIGLFHGGPGDYLEQRIYPDTEIVSDTVIDVFEAYDYIFLGHTHYRMDRMKGNCRVINPGSLGQPRDKNGFSYCIFDTETDTIEFRSVEVDLDMLIKEALILDGETDMYKYLLRKYR